VLQYVAVCRIVLQRRVTALLLRVLLKCVAVCCSVLQCLAVRDGRYGLKSVAGCGRVLQRAEGRCRILQCVAVHRSALQCVEGFCKVLQDVAVFHSRYTARQGRFEA